MSATPCRTLVVTAVAAVLSLGIAPSTHAADAPADTSCASQEVQVVKAEGALARLTALFEAKEKKVAEAKAAVAAAGEDELSDAQERLAKAQAKASEATKVKKAQRQRLAKAQARLAECQTAG